MRDQYTLSKFCVSTSDAKENILLFNTLFGTGSFCKISYGDFEKIKYEINSKKMDCSKEFYQKLIKKGILVSENTNEENRLVQNFYDTVMDNKLNLIISPTEQCNLRCVYCCEKFEHGDMKQSVIDGVVKYVENRINEVSSVNIDWFGGEPLLALDTILELSEKIMNICKKNRKSYSAFITTNGVLLTPEVFRKLYDVNIFTYKVTLDVAKEFHDLRRIDKDGRPTFDRILKNLLEIRNQDYGRFARIVILSNFSNDMYEKVREYKRFLARQFSADKRFVFSFFRILDLGGKRIEKIRNKLMSDGRKMDKIYDEIIKCDDCKLRFALPQFLKPGGLLCYAAKKNSFIIGSNGDIFKCEHAFQTKRELPIGRITEDGKMILKQEYADAWLARYMFCRNDECKLMPLCFGEDCIEKRIYESLKMGICCTNRLCHFDKESIYYVMKILDSEMNMFPMISS